MISKEEKLTITGQILKSKSFKRASTSAALLEYLVHANIEGSFLKEAIINIEFFGKKADTDKNNTRVRVSMYNLRKKLKEYYSNEAENPTWFLVIDKGQYSVRFEKRAQVKSWIKQLTLNQVLPYFLLLLTIAFFLLKNTPQKSPSVWSRFFKNNLPTTLFVGDAFGFRGTTITGSLGWTRDYHINTIDEYYALLEVKPALKEITNTAKYSYLTAMGPEATHHISKLFSAYQQDFDIRFSSKSTFTDIKNSNSIYIGPIRTKNKFIPIFNDVNPYFNIADGKLIFKHPQSLQDRIFDLEASGIDTDLAIVSRISGPQETEQFIFFSDHDMGVIATVEYFTNIDSLHLFSATHLKEKSNFTAVYKAYGKDRTNMELKVILVVPF